MEVVKVLRREGRGAKGGWGESQEGAVEVVAGESRRFHRRRHHAPAASRPAKQASLQHSRPTQLLSTELQRPASRRSSQPAQQQHFAYSSSIRQLGIEQGAQAGAARRAGVLAWPVQCASPLLSSLIRSEHACAGEEKWQGNESGLRPPASSRRRLCALPDRGLVPPVQASHGLSPSCRPQALGRHPSFHAPF